MFSELSTADCPRGTRQIASGCVAVQIPENAELDVYGHGWVCRRGYRNAGGRCVAVQIPENAEVDVYGHGWVCKRGYKLVSGECTPMTAEELQEYERALAAAMLRARVSRAACQDGGEPIEGESAEIVLQKSGCGDWFVADGPSGFYLLEWYGGYSPSEGDTIIGPINSYGMKDVCYPTGGRGRVWVDDYLLSKSSVLEKYLEKCD